MARSRIPSRRHELVLFDMPARRRSSAASSADVIGAMPLTMGDDMPRS